MEQDDSQDGEAAGHQAAHFQAQRDDVRARSRNPAQEQSRAALILIFGILSIVFCQLFGPFAWSMGTADLDKIDRGLMDPRERGLVQAGRICGIVGTVIMIGSVVILVAILALGSAAAGSF